MSSRTKSFQDFLVCYFIERLLFAQDIATMRSSSVMSYQMTSTPSSFTGSNELRILVVHNQDTLSSVHTVSGCDREARADVVTMAQEVARALASRGHFVSIRGLEVDSLPSFFAELQSDPPHLVFNLCESLAGNDRNEGVLPALLDLLQIPYTGSDPLALGITLQKDRTQQQLRHAGVSTPRSAWLGAVPQPPQDDLAWLGHHQLSYPLIVKPLWENASVGIHATSVVYNDTMLVKQIRWIRETLNEPMLIEEFIEGREVHVCVLGNSPTLILPLHEFDFSGLPEEHPRIISYEGKWHKESIAYQGIDPVPMQQLTPVLQSHIENTAQRTFAALELRDYARCDMRISSTGQAYVIDVNPNCDLSPTGGFARAARMLGYSYEELIDTIAHCALERRSYERQSYDSHSASEPFRSVRLAQAG